MIEMLAHLHLSKGTPLRKISEELEALSANDVVQSMVANGSIIDMPQFPRYEVNGLVKTFNMYVNFPESKWHHIEQAEKDTKEGRRVFEDLREEFVSTFWSGNSEKNVSFEASAAEINPLAS